MTELIKDIKYFWSHKCFAVCIPLITALAYGTLILNPTIGIDDTSFKVYYIDGVSPNMGRWCMYLIQKNLTPGLQSLFCGGCGPFVFLLVRDPVVHRVLQADG